MIGGLLVLVTLLVIRLWDLGPALPENIKLPVGVKAQAVTFGDGWIAVVTQDDRILILNSLTGAVQQELSIQ